MLTARRLKPSSEALRSRSFHFRNATNVRYILPRQHGGWDILKSQRTPDRWVTTMRAQTIPPLHRPPDEDTRSDAIRREASTLFPLPSPGVDDTIRTPILAKGKEATVTDVNGTAYIDFTAAAGSLILGYTDPRVAVAINKAVSKGCNVGSPTQTEIRLAEMIVRHVPGTDKVRFVNDRTAAIRYALTRARRHTGRQRVLAFRPDASWESDPVLLPQNDIETVRRAFHDHGSTLAAAVVQPIVDTFGPIPPSDGFLGALRARCDENDCLLVFDETATTMRLGFGGAATLFNVTPDLTVLGAALGGGLPLAACSGRCEIMDNVEPPIVATDHLASSVILPALAAGVATLETLSEPDLYPILGKRAVRLDQGLRGAAQAAGIETQHRQLTSMVGIYFASQPTDPHSGITQCDTRRFSMWWNAMLQRGVYLPPSPSSCLFVSTAHTDDDIDRTVEAAHDALKDLR